MVAAGMLAAPGTGRAEPPESDFGEIAARSERIDVRGVPLWMNGSFRVGDDATRGRVRRVATGRSESRGGPDNTADVVRRGRVSFDVTGPAVGGALAGECRYDRGEVRTNLEALTISLPTVPLLYRCTFTRDGRPVGFMELSAAPDRPGLVQRSLRRGRVEVGGTALDIESLHTIGARRVATDLPVGYAFILGDEAVGAIDVNGATRRRLALPRDAGQREAAMAAGLALALFWDPGDTDD